MSESQSVQQLTVSDQDHGQRLDNFLRKKLKGVPKSLVYRLIRKGQVRVNGGRRKADSRLASGDLVRVPPVRTASREVSVPEAVQRQLEDRVVFQNDRLLILDKPSGLAVHAGSGLSWGVIDALRESRRGEYLELVHRLDRETSGCLMLARNVEALREAQGWLKQDQVIKRYLCLLEGRLGDERTRVEQPLSRIRGPGGQSRSVVDPDGKYALTQFKVLERGKHHSFAEARIHTGRTHQIRAHAAFLGHPVAGDDLYGSRSASQAFKKIGLTRLFLHCTSLELPDGTIASAPLPGELTRVLDRLG
ncbi:MAG: RluA family pseudouridine synthase [Xanthomonadales bacterium]|nr:RluA family pseudouridine synthase [Xanthomonadales bacterium]